MPENLQIGRLGEEIAANFLLSKKYLILEKNIRFGNLEIDIIAKTPEGITEIIEVKTRNKGSFQKAIDALTKEKTKNLKKAAVLYACRKKISLEKMNLGFIAIELNEEKANISYFNSFLS